MVDENVNAEDMLNELSNWLDLDAEPSRDEGWFTINELLDNTESTIWRVRNRVEIGVQEGKLEKVVWSGTGYYKFIAEDVVE